MRFLIASILLISLLSFMFAVNPSKKKAQPKLDPKSIRFINKIIKQSTEQSSKKYPIYCVGVGMGGDCLKFSVEFEATRQFTRDEARATLFDIRNKIITNIIQNKHKDSYYSQHNFDLNNVSVTFYIRKKDSSRLFDPEISVACVYSGGTYFRTNDPDNRYRYKNTFKETPEEAETKNQEYLEKLRASPHPEL